MDTTAKPVRERGKGELIAAIVVNVIGLWFINNHDVWRPWLRGIVTPAFADVVWILNLGALAQILGNAVLLFLHPFWLRRATDVLFAVLGIAGGVLTLQVFPFDVIRFGEWAPLTLRILIVLGIAGTAIATLVNLVRFFVGPGPLELRRPAHR